MKSRGWTLNALTCILDSHYTNTKTVFREVSNKSSSTFNFIWDLGRELVTPLTERQFNNPGGLGTKFFTRNFNFYEIKAKGVSSAKKKLQEMKTTNKIKIG